MKVNNLTIIDVLRCCKSIAVTTFSYCRDIVVKKLVYTGKASKFSQGETIGSTKQPIYISNGEILPMYESLTLNDTPSNTQSGATDGLLCAPDMVYNIANRFIISRSRGTIVATSGTTKKSIVTSDTCHKLFCSRLTLTVTNQATCVPYGVVYSTPIKVLVIKSWTSGEKLGYLGYIVDTNVTCYYVINETTMDITLDYTKTSDESVVIRGSSAASVIKAKTCKKFTMYNGSLTSATAIPSV